MSSRAPATAPVGIDRYLPAATDVVWLVAALYFKQILAVESMLWHLKPGGVWMTLSVAALFGLLVLFLPQRGRPWVSLGVNSGLSFMLFGDVIYLRYFSDMPSFALMSASHQTFQVTDSVAMLVKPADLLMFVDLLPMALAAHWLSSKTPWKWTRPLAAAVFLGLLAPMIRWSWDAATAEVGVSIQRFSNQRVVVTIGVLGFHLLDAADVLRDTVLGWSVTEDDWRFVLDVMEERRPQRAGTGEFFGAARGFNLVMIQIETLEGPIVGLEIEGQEITPTLNRLARENLYLSLCLDQSARGRTSDAEILSQASLLPAEKGAAVFLHAGNELIGLADVMSGRGYRTAVGIAHKARFWNRRYSHPAFGFSQGWYVNDFEPGPRVGWGLNDRDFLRQAADRVIGLEQPFFALLLTLSNHHPFTGFPDDFRILDLETIDNEPVSGYLHSMRWADEAVRGFLEELDGAGLTESTVIVVWGDHDSSLIRSPEGARRMGLPYTKPDGLLYDRVPVIIRAPGVEGLVGTIDFPTGLSDLPPTVAALLGVDPQDLPWLGRNILGSPEDEPVIWGLNGWVDRTRIHRTVDPMGCWDRTTGRRAPDEMCVEGSGRAGRMRRVGTLILEGDLQGRLGEALSRTD
jgi:phosphoglycerol transferase MdoB-like AlkP superfamily enzyme